MCIRTSPLLLGSVNTVVGLDGELGLEFRERLVLTLAIHVERIDGQGPNWRG